MLNFKLIILSFAFLLLSFNCDAQFKAGYFADGTLQSEKTFETGIVFLSLKENLAFIVVEYDITVENGKKTELILEFSSPPQIIWQTSEYQIYIPFKDNSEGILSLYLTQDNNTNSGIILVYPESEFIYYTGRGVRWNL